jgi:DNA mismatch repair protein MutS
MSEAWVTFSEINPAKTTPMLRQYLQAKAECGDSLLFFRMGDFFELFLDDAVEAAELLGLTLTSRDGASSGRRIPMCGVPARAVDSYVAKAIRAGRTITICDQIEDPKEAKGIVKRAIIRTITPGTVMASELLEESSNNYLAALCPGEKEAGLAFVDVTTGEFMVAAVSGDIERTLTDELTRMAPAEVLIPAEYEDIAAETLRRRFEEIPFTPIPDEDFDEALNRDRLQDYFGLNTLKGVGLEDAADAVRAAGAVLNYVRRTQRDTTPNLQLPRRYSPSGYVVIDGNTQRNLELVESLTEKSKRGTLLGVLDNTRTGMGGRKLRNWILHPLLVADAIRARLGAVEEFHAHAELRMRLRERLKDVSDIERLMGKITAKSCNGRDVKALGRSLEQLPALRQGLADAEAPLLKALHESMDDLADVAEWIARALVGEPPVAIMEGNLIRDGYHEELDRLHGLVRGGRDWIAKLQQEERDRTGIQKLKVGYNKIFGYYIEVTKAHAGKVPEDYQRKQTLVNAERYITPTLKEREEEIVTAQEKMQTLEYDLFVELRDRIAGEARRIQATADGISTLDVLLALAETAVTKNYTKPAISENGEIHIRDGRHPVVEDLMSREEFVPNDTHLDPAGAAMVIVTGPNMAGKSTWLRQVALITLMAQIGSFVPAAEASIGVVDRIFTRVGASDNLVRGESTFMVEMIETANILNAATEKSLLVLDEIGRGTSTFDGISIAWSVAEHIHDRIHAKTLFATHYHELTELGEKLEHAKNINVAVREWGDRVVFLYRIAEGGADHSYGIQVAKLAGLPEDVLARAREILESLETGTQASAGLPEQMYLFGPAQPAGPGPVEKELDKIDPDELSPRDAHDLVRHLKHLANKPRGKK